MEGRSFVGDNDSRNPIPDLLKHTVPSGNIDRII